MKILLALVCATVLLFSKACDKKKADATTDKTTTSDCMTQNMEAFKKEHANRGNTSVFTFESGGSTYTVFDNGIAFDAQAYVLNNDCDTVHVYGGMMAPGTDVPKPPFDWKDMDARTQIWPEQ